MPKYRVDETVIQDGEIVGYQTIAYFNIRTDADDYVRRNAADALNPAFSYRVVEDQ